MRLQNKKLSVTEMKHLADGRGGKCLSKKYINAHTKLRWRCKEGHVWEATPSNIKYNNRWCPVCGGTKKLSINEMKKLVRSKGGKCLSTEYIDNKTKLIWQCKKEHIWKAIPSNVKRGQWCSICANTTKSLSMKLSIGEMKKLAKNKSGKCLSAKYIDSKTKLKWKCNKGHTWEAIPSHIKRHHWCPFCAGVAKLSIKDMQKLAKNRKGECLSTEYINNHTKLKWRCKEGHIWKATPKDIKSNKWCPICALKNKKIYRSFSAPLPLL